jgi:hypothetical protein
MYAQRASPGLAVPRPPRPPSPICIDLCSDEDDGAADNLDKELIVDRPLLASARPPPNPDVIDLVSSSDEDDLEALVMSAYQTARIPVNNNEDEEDEDGEEEERLPTVQDLMSSQATGASTHQRARAPAATGLTQSLQSQFVLDLGSDDVDHNDIMLLQYDSAPEPTRAINPEVHELMSQLSQKYDIPSLCGPPPKPLSKGKGRAAPAESTSARAAQREAAQLQKQAERELKEAQRAAAQAQRQQQHDERRAYKDADRVRDKHSAPQEMIALLPAWIKEWDAVDTLLSPMGVLVRRVEVPSGVPPDMGEGRLITRDAQSFLWVTGLDQPLACIRWIRREDRVWRPDLQCFVPCPVIRELEERHVALNFPAKDFATLLAICAPPPPPHESDSIAVWRGAAARLHAQLRRHLPGHIIIYLLVDMHKYVQCHRQRNYAAFQAALRGERADTPPVRRQRPTRAIDDLPRPTPDALQECTTQLSFYPDTLVFSCTSQEVPAMLASYTAQIALLPEVLARGQFGIPSIAHAPTTTSTHDAAAGDRLNFAERISTCSTPTEVWSATLQLVTRLTDTMARGIMVLYPTNMSLWQAYCACPGGEVGRRKMLEHTPYTTASGVVKRIGGALSERVYEHIMRDAPQETVHG